jgi:hypothetical protein
MKILSSCLTGPLLSHIFQSPTQNDRALNTSFVILWFIATRINSWLTRSVMKRIILNIHLCAGMIAALFLITLSLSGATIAFENELNRTFHPQLTNVKREGRPLDWDTVRDRVEQQSPGWKLIRFYFPDRPDRSTCIRLRSSTTHRIRHIYVNQYTGTRTGQYRGWEQLDPAVSRSTREPAVRQGRKSDRDLEHFRTSATLSPGSSCGGRVEYSAFNEHPRWRASIATCITPSASGPLLQCLPLQLPALPFTTRRASYLAS